MARFFTLAQAEELLPVVEPVVRASVELKAEYQASEAELQDFLRRIMVMGGTFVDREQVAARKSQRESCATRLKECLERLHSLGCLVKDLDMGLLDFPTLYRGQEVYLCWKLDESRIEYWHGATEGFRGRKKIDQEFLDHHKGDLTN